YLADLDNLQEVAAGHRDGRRGEADQAEAIVEQELGRFVESQRGRQIGPVVTALRARLLGMAKAETDKMLASFPQLGERERRSVSDLTEGLVKKILHTPQIALKKDTGESLGLAAAVQLLFDLPRVEPLADEESDDDADQKNATGR
ncbi:MAG TPA: hypothetical protein VMU50_14060, partial [Polyangia bacterium]|nr:hypothetical protein [Polyangia bacterium]